MAGYITINGTSTVNINNGNPSVPLGVNYQMTGSNATWTVSNLTANTWQSLDTGSLSNLRYAAFDNIGTASVYIATGSAGGNLLAKLLPNDNLVLPWDGLTNPTLYAYASGSMSILMYFVAEA